MLVAATQRVHGLCGELAQIHGVVDPEAHGEGAARRVLRGNGDPQIGLLGQPVDHACEDAEQNRWQRSGGQLRQTMGTRSAFVIELKAGHSGREIRLRRARAIQWKMGQQSLLGKIQARRPDRRYLK
ncbi:hypothetical protein [Variovorax sp. M-6]|uniref:hypothetical protein n=1 Tax=Variovorax sp. M-6 TaxID=3233041 RepID=UPI003F97CE67